MRTVCLYVLTLSLLLLGGYRYLYGGTRNSAYVKPATIPVLTGQQTELERLRDKATHVNSTLPAVDRQDDFSFEDDDDDTTSGRRQVLFAKCVATLVFASFLFFCYRDRHIRSFLFRPVYAFSSGKYILQRALRI